MTLLEAKIEACMRELGLSIEEREGKFMVYKRSNDRYSNASYLCQTINKYGK